MKKQLLIAAVAATMTSVAMADISITGAGMVKYTNADKEGTTADTNTLGHELDLKIVGKSGDTTVTATIDQDASNTAVWHSNVKTMIGPVEAQAGNYVSGANELKAKSTNVIKSIMSYDAGVAKIAYHNNSTGTGTEVHVSGNVGGFDLGYAKKSNRDEITVSGSVAGVALKYHNWDDADANEDKSFISASGTFNGVTATYAKAEADSSAQIDGDGFFGNVATTSANGDDFEGFALSTAVAGNTVELKNWTKDAATASTDVDNTKFTVTRPLASGSTLKASYNMADSEVANADVDTLEVKVTVAF